MSSAFPRPNWPERRRSAERKRLSCRQPLIGLGEATATRWGYWEEGWSEAGTQGWGRQGSRARLGWRVGRARTESADSGSARGEGRSWAKDKLSPSGPGAFLTFGLQFVFPGLSLSSPTQEIESSLNLFESKITPSQPQLSSAQPSL